MDFKTKSDRVRLTSRDGGQSVAKPNLPRCVSHTIGIPFTNLSSDKPLGSSPRTMASTMSGVKNAKGQKDG